MKHLSKVTMAVFLLLFTFLCNGCILTPMMWATAQSEVVYCDDLRGCVVDHSVSPPRTRGLIVACNPDINFDLPIQEAAIRPGPESFVLIPVKEDGNPVWPFGYEGNGRDVSKIDKGISSEQKAALQMLRFEQKDFEAGRRGLQSKDFVRAGRAGIRVECVRNQSGFPVWRYFEGNQEHVLILPYEQQSRPPKDRDDGIRTAIVLTPVAVVEEATVYAVCIAALPVALPLTVVYMASH